MYKEWQYYFFPSSLDDFCFFFCLIAMAQTSTTMLNNVATDNILVLFLILEERLLAFHHWVWCKLWVWHIWLYYVEICLSIPTLVSIFIMNRCWILSNTFSASIDMIMRFFIIGVVSLQYCVSFCYTMKWISYMYTYIPYLLNLPPTSNPHPTHLGHHRAPSWAPCALQQVPTSYLFYTRLCIYVNPNLPMHPTPLSPPRVHMFILYICVCIPALQIGSSVPFF